MSEAPGAITDFAGRMSYGDYLELDADARRRSTRCRGA